MSDSDKYAIIKELLDSAESSIHSARQILADMSGVPFVSTQKYTDKAAEVATPGAGKIVEGVFNGQNMVDGEGNVYPVPANYASKSKLVPGDVLKLTISDEGRFIYKQIGPVDRKTVVGPLSKENGQYMVFSGGKAYKVLLASVTYFKAEIGDKVSLVVPANEESEWGAIEAAIPKFMNDEKSEGLSDTDNIESDEKDSEDDTESKESLDLDGDDLNF